MTEKLYVDIKGHHLWEYTFSSGNNAEEIHTPYGNVLLQEKYHTEANIVSYAFFPPILWTINPVVKVYRNDKNEYAVMLIQQDAGGSSSATYMSLLRGFCFSEVYAYPKSLEGVNTIQLVMKTIDGIWFSFSLYQAPFAKAGCVLFHCNQREWDKYREKNEVSNANIISMDNLCEEGRHDLRIRWETSKL